jgi:hypothetical protein
MLYLRHHYEPDSNAELIRMQHRAKPYQIIGDELYKTLVTWPLLRCLSTVVGKELLNQIHSGVCGRSQRSKSSHRKSFRAKFLLAFHN